MILRIVFNVVRLNTSFRTANKVKSILAHRGISIGFIYWEIQVYMVLLRNTMISSNVYLIYIDPLSVSLRCVDVHACSVLSCILRSFFLWCVSVNSFLFTLFRLYQNVVYMHDFCPKKVLMKKTQGKGTVLFFNWEGIDRFQM